MKKRVMSIVMAVVLAACAAQLPASRILGEEAGTEIGTASEEDRNEAENRLPETENRNMEYAESILPEPEEEGTEVPEENIPEQNDYGGESTEKMPPEWEHGGSEAPEEIQSGQAEEAEREIQPLSEMVELSDGFFDSEDEWEMAAFSQENGEQLTAETAEEQEIARQIQSGEMIAFASLNDNMPLTEPMAALNTGDGSISARLVSGSYKIIVSSTIVNADEVWTVDSPIHAQARYIEYVDSEGTVRRSPLYCMTASKMGIASSSPGGDAIKQEAIRFLTNSTLKKILYFGYGGPGNICNSYDPSCSHVDWSKWQNRYVFTHQALSKVYANDVNGATAAQIEHVGLNRFINKIKSLTIPDRSAVKIRTADAAGNTVITNPSNVYMVFYRVKPSSGYDWLESSFQNGFQISRFCTVMDEGGGQNNGMTISRSSTDDWQLIYWNSYTEYQNNPQNPNVLARGSSVKLKYGARFRFIFPKNMSGTRSLTCQMNLMPVRYLIVDGNVQTGETGKQDFGACVYQGEKGSVTMNFIPQSVGSLRLTKKDLGNGKPVPGASYDLYTAEEIYNGWTLFYNSGVKIERGKTDSSGRILFENLPPGKYKVKEAIPASGYLLDTQEYEFTVRASAVTNGEVTDVPDIAGSVSVEKVITGTGISLSGAEFTLYSWNCHTGKYENGTVLSYDAVSKRYVSGRIVYNSVNLGKFQVRETKNPAGYTGAWAADIALTEPGTEKTFSYRVENSPAEEGRIEIRKIDAGSRETLTEAEFTVYPFSSSTQTYELTGSVLLYDPQSETYKSDILTVTDENLGRYKVVETRNPKDYTGSWEQEIDLTKENEPLQFTVENTPIPHSFGRVKLVKTDALTGEILKDGRFEVLEWNTESGTYQKMPGAEAGLIFDTEEQSFISGDIEMTESNEGKFLLRETENPSGYMGEWEQEFTLEGDGAVAELTAENQPVRLPVGEITVVKKIREDDITWAHGNPVFQFVVEGEDIRGNNRRYEGSVTYYRDSYEMDGDGFAVQTMTFSNIPIGEYKIYEKPVIRYYLKDAAADTANVTICRDKTPAYGIMPSEIAYGMASLDVGNKKASLTFVNEKSRYDDYSHNCVIQNLIPLSGEASS